MTKQTWDKLAAQQLWLVGRYHGPEPPEDAALLRGTKNPGVLAPWEFMGVFATREKAIAACSRRLDFVAPVKVDERAPEELEGFEDSFYPLTEDRAVAATTAK